jgi:hypothetical protein
MPLAEESFEGLAPSEQPAKDRWSIAEVVNALRASAGIKTVAAAKLGCGVRTIYTYVDRYWEVREALSEIHASTLDLAQAKLVEHIQNGSERSIHFYLQTQGKHLGYSLRTELTAPGGKPLIPPRAPVGLDLSKFSEAELEQFEALMSKAAGGADAEAA